MIDSLLEIRVRCEYSAMMPYVSSHITFAFDRQLLLADLVGDLPWACDLQAGTLSFGDRFGWRAEVLGTESEESDTWLWAWANEGRRIPAERQAPALQLKAWGEEHGVAELTAPLVPLGHADGQRNPSWFMRTTQGLPQMISVFTRRETVPTG